MKKNIIKPVGLKGNDALNRVRELMGMQPIQESTGNSVVELSKEGPDGKVYGIVREKHEYFIKIADKKQGLIAEDFQYIGGLKNKKSEAYDSYAKAIKHLNMKFISINEAHGHAVNHINVFSNDNLITESAEVCDTCGNTKCTCPIEEDVDVELNEVEQSIEEMQDKEYGLEEVAVPKSTSKLKIEQAMDMMDEAIDAEEKLAKLAESISESDLARIIALKKKA